MGLNESLLLASKLEIYSHVPNLLGQVDAIVVETPSFQSGQFIIAMIAGVILAFGFQLLLTNLSMAAGVSYVAHSSNSSSSSSDSSGGSPIKTIGIAFGLWTLITVSLQHCSLLVGSPLDSRSTPIPGLVRLPAW